MSKPKFDTKSVCMIGLMSALVFVGTTFRIDIPIGDGSAMLHFGNIFGILGGLLFGGIPGGLAAGIGSAIFDLTGKYAADAWITFINKFVMGYVAGALWQLLSKKGSLSTTIKTIIAAASGSAAYIFMYMLKTFVEQKFIMLLPLEGVFVVMAAKFGISLTNGITAVITSVLLASALRPALVKAHILKAT